MSRGTAGATEKTAVATRACLRGIALRAKVLQFDHLPYNSLQKSLWVG